jgi:ATP-binding cassette, subfamily F, member 3
MIGLQAIEKSFGSKVIYNSISASFHPSHRIGLVGPNGAGKTLLLRILIGEDTVDAGQVVIPTDLRLGYLPQEMNVELGMTPLELVLRPYAHLFEIEKKCEDLVGRGDTSSSEYRKAAAEFDRFQSELAVHDVFSLEPRAKTILAGLGVAQDTWTHDVAELSGGFRMRVMLAQLLLLNPDVLLLDEPTNHLNINSLI